MQDSNENKIQTREDLQNRRTEIFQLIENSETQIYKLDQQNVLNLIQEGKFSQALYDLDKAKDGRNGIERETSDENGLIIRNATKQELSDENAKTESPEKYAMQIVNQVRGVLLIAEHDVPKISDKNKEELKEKMNRLMEDGIKNIDKLSSDTIVNYNTVLIEIMKEAGIEKPEEKLKFTKEMANFDDKQMDVATLTKTQGNAVVIELDQKLDPLSEKQKKEYKAVATGEKEQPKWFTTLTPLKQNVVKQYAQTISEGNHTIPTQMLKELTGVRNAYFKTTSVKKENEGPKIVLESFHCGTPASSSKGDPQQIANQNVEALKKYAQEGGTLNLNQLNSRTPLNIGGENNFFKQLEGAKKKGVSVTATPANIWRAIGAGKDVAEYKNILKELSSKVKDEQLLKDIKNLQGVIDGSVKSKHSNMEIATKMPLIMNQASKIEGLDFKMDNVNFCKSGKDRTGIIEMINSVDAVAKELGFKNGSKEYNNLLKNMAKGGHTQVMTSVNSGTRGCDSVKFAEYIDTKEHLEITKGIIDQKSANFNSSIKQVKDNKLKSAIISEFNNDKGTSISEITKKSISNENKKPVAKEEKSAKEEKPIAKEEQQSQTKSSGIGRGAMGIITGVAMVATLIVAPYLLPVVAVAAVAAIAINEVVKSGNNKPTPAPNKSTNINKESEKTPEKEKEKVKEKVQEKEKVEEKVQEKDKEEKKEIPKNLKEEVLKIKESMEKIDISKVKNTTPVEQNRGRSNSM